MVEEMRRQVADMRRDIDTGRGGREEAVRAECEEVMERMRRERQEMRRETEESGRVQERERQELQAVVDQLRVDLARATERAERAEQAAKEAEAKRGVEAGEWRGRVGRLQAAMEERMALCMDRVGASEGQLVRVAASLSSLAGRTREREAELQSRALSLSDLLAQQTALREASDALLASTLQQHSASLASLHASHASTLSSLHSERDRLSSLYHSEVQRLSLELERLEDQREEREQLIADFLLHYPPPTSASTPSASPARLGRGRGEEDGVPMVWGTPCREKAEEVRVQMQGLEGEVEGLRVEVRRRLEKEEGMRRMMADMERREEEGEREVEGLRMALREVRDEHTVLRSGWMGTQLDMSGEGGSGQGVGVEGQEKENAHPHGKEKQLLSTPVRRGGHWVWRGSCPSPSPCPSPLRTPSGVGGGG